MSPIARGLIATGLLLVVLGVVWQVVGRYLPLGRLPGDVVVDREHFGFYFPVATCILISVALTLAGWLWRYFTR
ncbi:MAG TPA: DUF2905 domain-containing protein [Pirellulales bacterium]|nr:DUF2905 domain-containing protein [Pirellulales bacterium]